MSKGRWDERYELLEAIGEGDLCIVYRARDMARDRPVLLKMLKPHLNDDQNLVERFQRETERLISLRHPNILPIRAVDIGEDAVYLVSDIPAGRPLEQRLAGHGPLDIDGMLSVVSQVAEALDHAQEQGVCHHDLRPANIYLDGNKVSLINFQVLEAPGATPVYMAPEQLDETSAQAADGRSDAYSLGVVVYEMLTGRPPFRGTAADVAAAHLSQRPTPPRTHNPDLLPALDVILLKALAKQPENRYQTAGELVTALHEAVQVAQTRRMADDGVFDRRLGMSVDAAPKTSSLGGEGKVPTWVWVGLGILLAVVVAIGVLLATG